MAVLISVYLCLNLKFVRTQFYYKLKFLLFSRYYRNKNDNEFEIIVITTNVSVFPQLFNKRVCRFQSISPDKHMGQVVTSKVNS